VVVVVGEPADGIADGLRAADTPWHGEAIVTAGRDEALAWVRKNVAARDVVLVKASNGVALWVIAEQLLAHVRDQNQDRDRAEPEGGADTP
jgi:UDP-N-acetylmuramoyl-tripeptide--D-alanyl-D-alanine ligase